MTARGSVGTPGLARRVSSVSPNAVLTFERRLTAADHGASTLARVADQMSWPPLPPARFEEKTTSSPSLWTFGWMSFAAASLSSANRRRGPEAQVPGLPAGEALAGHRRRAAREVQMPLDIGRACSSSALSSSSCPFVAPRTACGTTPEHAHEASLKPRKASN
jgi:hypothetical protein